MLLDFSKFTTKISTYIQGLNVGTDEYGNQYYESNKTNVQGRKRRWVIYKGMSEPTKIPPRWFAWIHYMTDEPLDFLTPTDNPDDYKWLKPHQPNLTGTKHAYVYKKTNTQEYEGWKP